MNIKSIKKNFVQYKEIANDSIEVIKRGNFQNPEELHIHLYPYVLGKYLLYGSVEDIFSLKKLADLSVAKAARINELGIEKYDNPATCEGTTSAMNKKVLLLMALQKELDIEFVRGTIADVETTKDLATLLFGLIKED